MVLKEATFNENVSYGYCEGYRACFSCPFSKKFDNTKTTPYCSILPDGDIMLIKVPVEVIIRELLK